MRRKFVLPMLSKETLSAIAYGMENQGCESVLCLDDGNVYPADGLDGCFEDVDEHVFVPLPEWSSSDGYRLMCSFVQSCDDGDLKKRLSTVLTAGPRGVFRRFKAALEEDGQALSRWYEFKDRKIAAYILAWYRKMAADREIGLERGGDETIQAFELMADYDVMHTDALDEASTQMIQRVVVDCVSSKILGAFQAKEAFCAYRNGELCGQIVFEVVDDVACVLFYYIDGACRGGGLFGLLFDFMNRELERRGVLRVAFPVPAYAGFDLKAMLLGHGVASKALATVVEYGVGEWNGAVESAEMAYIV